jgi:phosphoribosylformylglycinamidine cyclo-ligase
LPPVFRWLAETARMAEPELLKTFNCGIGMILVVRPDAAASVQKLLEDMGESVFTLGRVITGEGVVYQGRLL